MKNRFVIVVSAFLMLTNFSMLAQKKNNKQKIVYDVSMTCENCKKRIEKNISFEKGVKDLKVDLPSKTVTIEFQENKTDTTKLRKAIEKLGYEVFVSNTQETKVNN